MKKNILWVLFLASILYLISCEENPVSYDSSEDKYTPLNVGSFWFYSYVEAGVTNFDTERIVSKTDDGFYKVEGYGWDDHQYITWIYTGYYKIMDEGLMYYNEDKLNGSVKIKRPYKTGTSWNRPINDSTLANYAIVDDNLTYDTPAGTFSGCITYRRWKNADSTNYIEWIYAPNVGCIKLGDYLLQSYHIH